MAYYKSFDNTEYDASLGAQHLASSSYDNEAGRSGFFTLTFDVGAFDNLIAITRTGTESEVTGDAYKIQDEVGNKMTEEQLRQNVSLNIVKFDEVLPEILEEIAKDEEENKTAKKTTKKTRKTKEEQ